MAVHYTNHKLSSLVSVEDLVSADYLRGTHVARYTHSHTDAWELVFCMKNRMKAFVDGKSTELQQGDSLFIRPGTLHDILVESDVTRAFVIAFTCSNSDLLMPLEEHIIVTGEEERHIFSKMREELETAFIRNPGNLHLYTFEPSETSPLGSEQMICCYLEQIIILMLRDVIRKGDVLPKAGELRDIMQNYLITRVNGYVTQHYNEPLSVGQIAAQFHYSRTRFSTIYKGLTGKGVNEMISEVRIECAKDLLRQGGLSISEVAERCGFSSLQYFSHKFAERMGMSPTEYVSQMSLEDPKE